MGNKNGQWVDVAVGILIMLLFASPLLGAEQKVQYNEKCGSENYDPRIWFCDTRDNQVYRYVKIGAQTWMAENLNYGKQVPGASEQTGKGEKYCYGDKVENCDTHGGLYQWHQALDIDYKYNTSSGAKIESKHQGICPAGWHVPSASDWDTLLDYVSNDVGTEYQAGSLMARNIDKDIYWATHQSAENVLPKDKYGFSALAGGGRFYEGYCRGDTLFCWGLKWRGLFWSSDESGDDDPTTACFYDITDDAPYVSKICDVDFFRRMGLETSKDQAKKIVGCSLRCVKD